ncbi:hypothetical protein M5689_025470 [Euphorbia peplus]|nr:hypothetical protein M5689_025470 [Euphorbia peplus]
MQMFCAGSYHALDMPFTFLRPRKLQFLH